MTASADLFGLSRWDEMVCDTRQRRREIEQRLADLDVTRRVLTSLDTDKRVHLTADRDEVTHTQREQRKVLAFRPHNHCHQRGVAAQLLVASVVGHALILRIARRPVKGAAS